MIRPFRHSDGTERLPKGSWRLVSPMDFARTHAIGLAVSLVVVVFIAVGAIGFNAYLNSMFFSEGSSSLSMTYSQVANSFELFANRNWDILDTWENSLEYASSDIDVQQTWSYQADQQQAWHYSDFYLFNQNNDFVTASGRSGTAGSISSVFDKMFEGGTRIASSYVSSKGVRKIVFAKPLNQSLEIDGVTYTGIALSYDNDYVEGLITSNIYAGQSDCYMVDQEGEVVFSLAPKTIFSNRIDNLTSCLDTSANFTRGSANELSAALATSQTTSAQVSYEGSSYYVVSQPAGIFGWSIVGIVKSDAVDEIPNKVRNFTFFVNLVLSGLLFAGILFNLALRYRRHISKEIQGRKDAEYKTQLNRQLVNGMTEVADRFAIVDLTTGTYRYRECQLSEPLYPEQGPYDYLLEKLTQRYAALTDSDDAKMGRLLNEEALRSQLKTDQDRIKIEYAARTEHLYMLMTVVPLFFDENGELAHVLLIGQDIGLRKELENAANTDDLTGLFNERYFVNILSIKQKKAIPFTLFYLDLDKFKPVNDTYGHSVGDKVLKRVSARLQDCIRTDDFAFRIGGDEFAVIITGGLDDKAAEQMKRRLVNAVSAPYSTEEGNIVIGTSCGYATWPTEATSISQIRMLADQRMYESKLRHHEADGTTR